MTIKREIKDSVVQRYLEDDTVTQKQIGIEFGIGRDTVLKILLEYKIPIRGYTGDRSMVSRRRVFDFEFFNQRSPTVAYWAGFLMADGCIHIGPTGGATLTCYVHPDDHPLMKKFYEDIQYNEPLKYRKEGYVGFELHYAKFPEQLKFWGITPNKTKLFSPREIPMEILPDYLRGWVDGDGTVFRTGTGARVVIASGNRPSMEWFSNSLHALGYNGHIGIYDIKAYPGNVQLYISGAANVSKVAEILKADTSFCLDRKWKRHYDLKPRDR